MDAESLQLLIASNEASFHAILVLGLFLAFGKGFQAGSTR